MRHFLVLTLLLAFSCTDQTPPTPTPIEPVPVEQAEEGTVIVEGSLREPPKNAQAITLWATYYYMKEVPASSTGVPLRDMNNNVIGPKLSAKTWCLAAIEGTVRIKGQTYNYAGTRSPRQAKCSHSPSSYVRWKKSKFKYGIGNKNNELIPFRTIACDQGTVSRSQRWLNGGYMKFGQEIYIPAARGVKLPDGTIHDGYFQCGDTGGAIYGHHIDVFIGSVPGGNDVARKINPFNFIKSTISGQFKAFLVPDNKMKRN